MEFGMSTLLERPMLEENMEDDGLPAVGVPFKYCIIHDSNTATPTTTAPMSKRPFFIAFSLILIYFLIFPDEIARQHRGGQFRYRD